MANQRDVVLWQMAKRHGTAEIRDMIEEQAPRVADAIANARHQFADAIAALRQQLIDALSQKASLTHTHPRADVTGLNAILNALDARLTALEARVTVLETPPPP